MSLSKPKLGSSPLAARGIAALFPEGDLGTGEKSPGDTFVVQEPIPILAAGRRRVRKPAGANGAATVRQFVETVRGTDDGTAGLSRHTFYLTEAQGKKIKLYALLHGLQISEVMRWLVDEHVSVEP